VPDDLLELLIGPTPYAARWIWVATVSLCLLVVWYLAVLLVTAPDERARKMWHKWRFGRAVRAVGDRYRAGEMPAKPAAAAIRQALRGYLFQVTGVPMTHAAAGQLAKSELHSAAWILAQLADLQFNPESSVDVGELSDMTEELIRTWG
jgi:hypothetical protein